MSTYICGDGRRFPNFEMASEHANRVFQKRGIIIAIETKPSKRHPSPFAKRDPGFARRTERLSRRRERVGAIEGGLGA